MEFGATRSLSFPPSAHLPQVAAGELILQNLPALLKCTTFDEQPEGDEFDI
jgi:hypothetical protein